jgi:hypothetical protein
MRHRAEHIRIRKPHPRGSEVILMLLLRSEEKPNLKRPRRTNPVKNNHPSAKLPPAHRG